MQGAFFLFWFLIPNLSWCFFKYSKEIFKNSREISTKVTPLKISRGKRAISNMFKFNLKVDENFHEVVLKRRISDVVDDNFTVYIYESEQVVPNVIQNDLFEGYFSTDPQASSVNGFLKNDCFYGELIANKTRFRIEEVENAKNKSNNALLIQIDNMIDSSYPKVNLNMINKHFKKWKGKGKLCSVVIVLDNSFVELLHNGDSHAAVTHVLFSIEEANSIFRITDFDNDGVPDNIGISIFAIFVVKNTKGTPYFIREFSKNPIDVREGLVYFIRFPYLQLACLGLLLTGQVFQNGVLGGSFVATTDAQDRKRFGGICQTFIEKVGFTNAIIVTPRSVEGLIKQLTFENAIAHEIGHSFGAFHDREDIPECRGYLMAPHTLPQGIYGEKYLMFSNCSKRTMMAAMVVKGGCLQPVSKPFCGNGILEVGEQCDCGMTLNCLFNDPCCVPRRTVDKPCTIYKKTKCNFHIASRNCTKRTCKRSGNSPIIKHLKTKDSGGRIYLKSPLCFIIFVLNVLVI